MVTVSLESRLKFVVEGYCKYRNEIEYFKVGFTVCTNNIMVEVLRIAGFF